MHPRLALRYWAEAAVTLSYFRYWASYKTQPDKNKIRQKQIPAL